MTTAVTTATMSLSTTMLRRSSTLPYHTRHSRFPLVSLPIIRKLHYPLKFPSSSANCRILIVRNSSNITAKPSSEFQKKPRGTDQEDRLHALRQLFTRPDINIDAYIIPSQDAHQVRFRHFIKFHVISARYHFV